MFPNYRFFDRIYHYICCSDVFGKLSTCANVYKVWERQLFSFLLVEGKEKGGAFDNYLQFFLLISLKMIISVIHKYYFSNFWIYRWDSLMSLLLNLCRLPANTKTFLRSPQRIILDVFFAAIKNVLTRKVILRVFYLRYKIHDLVKRS